MKNKFDKIKTAAKNLANKDLYTILKSGYVEKYSICCENCLTCLSETSGIHLCPECGQEIKLDNDECYGLCDDCVYLLKF